MKTSKPWVGLEGDRRQACTGGGHWFLWLALGWGCLGGGAANAAPDCVELRTLKRTVVANYAAQASVAYERALAAARELDQAIAALVERPSETLLKAAREAWIAARVPYSQTEAYRFYDGPIDAVETRINSWPIDEQYIDYVAEVPGAGVINDTNHFPTISRELILSLNEKEGKKNISTGFHAIEFLLWGQDRSATGPGNRPWNDFADGTRNAGRRRTYLRIVTQLLVEDLGSVAAAWRDGDAHNYRAGFLAAPSEASLANILKGLGALSGPEVAGERLTTPRETKEQEEEQDCFSDNTCNDLVNNALGIRNVYFGHCEGKAPRGAQSPGLHELLTQTDPALATRLAGQVEAAVAAARAIPPPFDQAILGGNSAPGRIAIKQAITVFQTESDLFAQAATVLGFKLNL